MQITLKDIYICPLAFKGFIKTYMGKENLFNIKLLAFYVMSLSLSLFIMNNSFVGNNKLYQ